LRHFLIKKINLIFYLFILLPFILFVTNICLSKKNQPHPVSFYFWKTQLNLSEYELETLKSLKIEKIYLRLFDVDRVGNINLPVGEVTIIKTPINILIIPVIYITNRSLVGLEKDSIQKLAVNVLKKTEKIMDNNHLPLKAIQFDCDWTDSTRNNYFYFLKEIQNISKNKIALSTTIRLHQIKYREKTGIPPVQEGFLMFYNMGQINEASTRNSIFNKEDASKYLSRLENYPIPLSYILPIFSWVVHFRDGRILDLITKKDMDSILNSTNLEKTKSDDLFLVKESFLSEGRFFKVGDLLKKETISSIDLIEAAELLKNSNKQNNYDIIFFDLDEINLKRITNETLNKTISIFN